MPNYRIACQEQDGSWTLQEFQADDDSDAISFGLSVRKDNRCELFREYYWLASFDGMAEEANAKGSHTNENTHRHYTTIETEVAYFHRRALEEREWARISVSSAAELSHLRMAENFEGLARAVKAERQRLSFYDVNASQASDAEPNEQRLGQVTRDLARNVPPASDPIVQTI